MVSSRLPQGVGLHPGAVGEGDTGGPGVSSATSEQPRLCVAVSPVWHAGKRADAGSIHVQQLGRLSV